MTRAKIDLTCFNWIKIIHKSKLSSNAKYVAHYLRTFMNENNDIAWPSQSRMVSEMGISKDTLCKKLNELEQGGWLIRERGGPTKNTRYMIHIPIDAVEKYALLGGTTIGLGSTTDVLGSTATGLEVVRPSDTNNNSNNKVINKKFIPPTVDEVRQFVTENKYSVNPEQFVAHYEANGWYRGKNKVKCWKSCVRYWNSNNKTPTTKAYL